MSAGAAASPLPRSDLAQIAAVRVAVSGAVLLFGFRSVSDDDFSRVVIAEQLAHAPKLDPSGTSWLPFPFWINGAAMLFLGRNLLVAHLVALLLGVASSVLVAIAAQRLGADRKVARLAGHFATLVGWSAWLGVATVPELFTAALTLFAAATLATASPRDRMLGALALLAATLSRYEPWPVAAVFALWSAIDVARHRRPPSMLLASLLAIAGPALWIAWNRFSHGDALHFVARVTAYRRALGDAANESTLARVVAYPGALAREMPEVVLPAALAAILALWPRARAAVLARARACAAPLALAAVQIVALSGALVKDGAPTHHPERAVLFPALALVVFLAGFEPDVKRRLPRRALGVAAAVLVVRAAVMPAVARLVGPTRPTLFAHLVRQVTPAEAFIDRRPEVAIGVLTAETLAPGTKVYIEDVEDYGYFAILAGSGRPEDFVLSGDPDPRSPKKPTMTFERGAEEYALFLRAQGIGHVIARGGERENAAAERWGMKPLRRSSRFDLWQVP